MVRKTPRIFESCQMEGHIAIRQQSICIDHTQVLNDHKLINNTWLNVDYIQGGKNYIQIGSYLANLWLRNKVNNMI